MKSTIYYFGCYKETGHYLYSPDGRRYHSHSPDLNDHFPVQINALDGGLIPPSKYTHPDGRAFLSHINGWTVVSFNDSSLDRRPGSHSVFIVLGIMTFDKAIGRAMRAFPDVFARFGFQVVPSQAIKEAAQASGVIVPPPDKEAR